MDYTQYSDNEGDAAALALVAEQAAEISGYEDVPVEKGAGWAVFPDGREVDWRKFLPRPAARAGRVGLTDVDSLVGHVNRNATEDTTLWGDAERARFVAVYNDHPANQGDDLAVPPDDTVAGRRDDVAVLTLAPTDDWTRLLNADSKMLSQSTFAELIEDLSHVVVDPESARLVEIAQTLSMRKTLDVSSRTRVGGGDVSYNLTEETTTRAGRGPDSIEIPTRVTFHLSIWSGTEPVEIDARLRVKEVNGAPCLGLRLMQRDRVVREAFGAVRIAIDVGVHDFVPAVLLGDPGVRSA